MGASFRSLRRRALVVGGLSSVLLLSAAAAAVVVAARAPSAAGALLSRAAAPAPRTTATTAPPILTQWGTKGSGRSQFDRPVSIAVGPEDAIYVVDESSCRVQKFDANGKYLTEWGGRGSKDGEFTGRSHLAVAPNGDVYVLDSSSGRVQVFAPDGTFLFKWGSNGKDDDQFGYAYGIAIDGQGRVFIGDRDKDRICIYSSHGGLIRQWGQVGVGENRSKDLAGIAITRALPDGRVYVLEGQGVREYGLDAAVKNSWGGPGAGAGQFAGPFAIAVDAFGSVYVSDNNNSRFQVFSGDGRFVRQWRFNEPGYIHGMAVGSDNSLYVIDYFQNWVRRYGPPARDNTPPSTTVKGADDKWHNRDVTLTFTATDNDGGSGVSFTEARKWGYYDSSEEYVDDWSTWFRGSSLIVHAVSDHTMDGERRVEVRSVDLAANKETPQTVTVRIDTKAPESFVLPLKASSVKKGDKVVVRIRLVEELSEKVRFDLGVYSEKLDKLVLTKKTGWVKLNRRLPHTWTFTAALAPGKYSVWAAAQDLAGNEGEADSTQLTVK